MLPDDATPASYISEKMQEIVADYADRISDVTIEILKASFPAFLAGCSVQTSTAQHPQEQPESGNNMMPEDEIDWAFLGET